MSVTYSVRGIDTSLNVSNRNSSIILFELLNYDIGELDPSIGELNPTDVLCRLANSEFRAQSLTRPEKSDQQYTITPYGVGLGCIVYDKGLSAERIGEYIKALRTLAEYASSQGLTILYS